MTIHKPNRGLPDQEYESDVSFGYQEVTPEEKDRLVREHFDSIAGKYDIMNSFLSLGFHHLWKRKAIRTLAPEPGWLILDACGGTGDLAVLAADRIGKTGSIIICDINFAMMEAGKPKILRSPVAGRIAFVQGDAEGFAFRNDSFDAVTVGFGIRNFTRLEKGLREIYRVLKPKGRFLCLEFSRPTSRFFNALYDLYSFVWMPLAGQIFAGTRKAYTYLPESIRVFPSPDRLIRILEEIGFSRVIHKRLTNGIASIYLARK
ncbi:MAG: Ubiquinone/menaquinone biosynthesis C-methyltransferase UbiE [Syntrophorhabdus sp. PtaU1.Bin153]|nr:MAG: Ubiquinone/menaquinone biosynthesis C-methyltransferase UbiE [Syntrophorhabdus sp. PtaU1.Bin153]